MNALNPPSQATQISRRTFGISVLAAAVVGFAACSDSSETAATAETSATETSRPAVTSDPPSTAAPVAEVTDFYDSSVLHSITLSFDAVAFDAMIEAFAETGDKGWLEADVIIDGNDYRQVGVRLKGNSSLSGLGGAGGGGPGGFGGIASASADEPEGLPWLIRLDKYVEDQNHDGLTEFVVRSNSSATAMNEAVSVELLDAAGLPTQRASAVEFTVNDRTPRLRLVLENPNQAWTSDHLGDGKLYKADASGDYSYRGDDPASYTEAWEQEAGEDDLTPLIEFLDFVNNADDATFVAELDDHLDVDAFATYMAIEDLLQNFDDISGPGNNSYLYLDDATGRFTVVAWDHNLALSGFGAGARGGFDPTQIPGGGTLPEGFDPSQIPGGTLPEGFDPPQIPGGTLPEGFDPPQFPGGGPGAFGKSNALADRFMAAPEFTARYDDALARLRAELFESGTAQRILDQWSSTLLATATHLVDAATIESEKKTISRFFVAE